ncbi:copper amine oxidase [Bacillus suaedae]|uniref:Copper amine oxidase n=1 Tax=Halalkalibacter suaedae TaxID=2822140 RepID=A0A940WV79_9BACI|nr:copper amine oxidase [Bacillus suaedae]MBP3952891.1 copper amine oxidase [Bacillus suaedae]
MKKNLRKSMMVVPLSLSLLFVPTMTGLAHEGHSDGHMHDGSVSVSTPASDLRATLDQYLSEHAFLAIYTMQKGVDGAEDFDEIAVALNQNTEDLSVAVASVYGDEAGEQFKEMWSAHIGFFVDYVVSTAEENEEGRQAALAELDQYRTDFSTFLETATEERLEASALAEGLQMHVDQLVWAFDQYVEGNYDATYENAREAVHHMYGVGKGLSTAITDQFPDEFEETTPATPAADLRANLNHLLSEHAGLAVFAMQKGIDGAADFDAIAAALNENTSKLSDAISAVYGEEGGDVFEQMWSEHIGYFVDYVVATAEENEEGRREALMNLDNYREDFSAFLETATEERLEATALADGLQMHVDQLVMSFDSYVAGDYEAAYQNAREAYAHMFGVGESLSSAIVDQFPDSFTDKTPTDMPKTGLGGTAQSGFSMEFAAILIVILLAGSSFFVLRRKQA